MEPWARPLCILGPSWTTVSAYHTPFLSALPSLAKGGSDVVWLTKL